MLIELPDLVLIGHPTCVVIERAESMQDARNPHSFNTIFFMLFSIDLRKTTAQLQLLNLTGDVSEKGGETGFKTITGIITECKKDLNMAAMFNYSCYIFQGIYFCIVLNQSFPISL